MNEALGKPINRVDGKLKVTGAARYASDWAEEKIAHGVLFESSIPSGRIQTLHLEEAGRVPGVIDIITHLNAPKIKKGKGQSEGSLGENFIPLQNDEIYFNGQYLGVVVAESLEAAQEAARLIRVEYHEKSGKTDYEKYRLSDGKTVSSDQQKRDLAVKKGNVKKALLDAKVSINQEYRMPMEHHNPMEPHSTLALFRNGQLKVYDATQGVSNCSHVLAESFQTGKENTQVITKFMGGGFGCKGSVWPHVHIAVMAAQKTKRPVKLTLTRQQMFFSTGYRAQNVQTLTLGAAETGKLVAMKHETSNPTSMMKEYPETCAALTKVLYACDNIETDQKVVKLNQNAPTYMRAPGESSGSFALESAMDELAHALKLDPIEFRLRNYAEQDPVKKIPFSSKSLKECYERGAKEFGWQARNPEPGQVKKGDFYVGYGMATSSYPVHLFQGSAKVELHANGKATVQSSTQDLGTGTYTAMTQLSAEALKLKLEQVSFDLGDSHYPEAGVSGGSSTVSSVGWAIYEGARQVHEQLAELAVKDKLSPLYGLTAEELKFEDGKVIDGSDPTKAESYFVLMQRNGKQTLSALGKMDDKVHQKHEKEYSSHSFGAQFVEVHVHAHTGEVRVSRMVGAFAAGKIVNPKTAHSQFMGGMIFGIGAALMEHSFLDPRNGRQILKDLADYHVPVNRDVPEITILSIDEEDKIVNPAGTKGIGEIGIVGTAAAIANAVFNATGVRVRDLPITPEKVALALKWEKA